MTSFARCEMPVFNSCHGAPTCHVQDWNIREHSATNAVICGLGRLGRMSVV